MFGDAACRTNPSASCSAQPCHGQPKQRGRNSCPSDPPAHHSPCHSSPRGRISRVSKEHWLPPHLISALSMALVIVATKAGPHIRPALPSLPTLGPLSRPDAMFIEWPASPSSSRWTGEHPASLAYPHFISMTSSLVSRASCPGPTAHENHVRSLLVCTSRRPLFGDLGTVAFASRRSADTV